MKPDAVEVRLASPDPEERRQAVGQLAELPGSETLPHLLRAMGDTDWRVRKEATAAAMTLATTPGVLQGLVKALGPDEQNVGLRNAAVEALGGCGAAAVDALSVALTQLDADGRKLAAEALGYTNEAGALLVLRGLVFDADPNVRVAAVEAIAALGAARLDDAAPVLEGCLDAADGFLRMAALDGLNHLGVVLSWGRIQLLLRAPELERGALLAAGRAAHPDAAPVLADGLRSVRRSTRQSALHALVDFVRGGEEAVQAARVALRSLPESVHKELLGLASGPAGALVDRRAALVVVGALGNTKAANIAIAALLREDVAAEAEEALTALGAVAMPALIERIAAPQETERARCIELVGRLADSDTAAAAAEAVRSALSDALPEVVEAALTALARVGDEACLHPAADLLGSDIPGIRGGAVAAVRAIAARHPAAARALAQSAKPEDPRALAAVIINGTLPPPVRASLEDDIEFLTDALSAESTLVRRAAVDALARVGSERAVEAVAFVLGDEEAGVRRAAVRALGTMRMEDGRPAGVEHLLELVRRSDDQLLVTSAVIALGEAGDARALDVLAELVRSGAPMLAVHAVEALGGISHPRRAEVLGAALGRADIEVVKAALQMLADKGEPGTEVRLAECLQHPMRDVRRLAADLLGRLGSYHGVAQLRQRLAAEEDPLVREALHRALAELETAAVQVRHTTPPPLRQR